MVNERKVNLDVEIGILEAMKGLKPKLFKCKIIASKRRKKEELDLATIDTRLEELRSRKCEQKIFSVKKELCRLVKKIRNLSSLKAIKKLKSLPQKDEPSSVSSLRQQELEERKTQIKHLDLAAMADFMLQEIVCQSDILREKITLAHSHSQPDSIAMEILSSPTIKERQTTLVAELVKFVEELYRLRDEPVDKEKPPTLKSQKKRSLQGKGREPTSKRSKPMIVQEGHEGKKNRKGQRARRAEWERIYGARARHLQEAKEDAKSYTATTTIRPNKLPSSLHPKHKSLESDDRQPLHPSWQAKKQQAELQRIVSQGGPVHQRIVFKDDE